MAKLKAKTRGYGFLVSETIACSELDNIKKVALECEELNDNVKEKIKTSDSIEALICNTMDVSINNVTNLDGIIACVIEKRFVGNGYKKQVLVEDEERAGETIMMLPGGIPCFESRPQIQAELVGAFSRSVPELSIPKFSEYNAYHAVM